MSDEENWTMVASKPLVKKTKAQQAQPVDIPLDALISKIRASLSPNKEIFACFVYGSRARRTNKPTSDVDLLVFFKHPQNFEDLSEIKAELVQDIGIAVDFVACVRMGKWVEHDERDQCYFDQVALDAIQVIGDDSLSYLVSTSRKLKKVK